MGCAGGYKKVTLEIASKTSMDVEDIIESLANALKRFSTNVPITNCSAKWTGDFGDECTLTAGDGCPCEECAGRGN